MANKFNIEKIESHIANLLWTLMFVLAVKLVDWESLTGKSFKDLRIYTNRINELSLLGDASIFAPQDIWGHITTEYAWLILLRFIANSGVDPYTGLSVLSAICCAVLYRELSVKIGAGRSALVLFNPLFIDLVNSQLRITVAISIFIISSWLFKITIKSGFFAFALSAVHTAMTLISALVFISSLFMMKSNKNFLVNLILFWLSGIVFALVLAFGADLVAATFSDRRAYTLENGQSFAYLIFWPVLAFGISFLIWQRRKVSMSELIGLQIIIVGAVSSFAGFPGMRLIAAGQTYAFSSLQAVDRNANFLTFLIVTYNILQFAYWLGILGNPLG